MQVVEITIRGSVPDNAEHVGPEAVYLTGDKVRALVQHLLDIGLMDVRQTRRLINAKAPRAKPESTPHVVAPAA